MAFFRFCLAQLSRTVENLSHKIDEAFKETFNVDFEEKMGDGYCYDQYDNRQSHFFHECLPFEQSISSHYSNSNRRGSLLKKISEIMLYIYKHN